MSLTKCKECGGAVSTKATTCPHCGNQIKRTAGGLAAQAGCGCLMVFVGFAVIAFLIYAFVPIPAGTQ